ncbi:unnamed protein product [Trichobilharzia szidati]|nr:unnamed protein product [Trichobilharzia szidati]
MKRHRHMAVKFVDELVRQPLVYKQIAQDFCHIVTRLIPIMKSTTDHSSYLNAVRKVEPAIFSLNLMLKHNKVHYLLSEKNLFTSLKQVHKLLNSISPPFQNTILRDLSVQYRSQAEYKSRDALSSAKQNVTIDKSTDNNDTNMEHKCDIKQFGNLTIKSDPTTTSTTVDAASSASPDQQSKRKSRKRSKPTSP